jgi:hypothetical protein
MHAGKRSFKNAARKAHMSSETNEELSVAKAPREPTGRNQDTLQRFRHTINGKLLPRSLLINS